MTPEEVANYWPQATPNQRCAISAYHDAGYQIELGIDENNCIEMSRANHMDTTDHFVIWSTGRVTSRL